MFCLDKAEFQGHYTIVIELHLTYIKQYQV